MQRERPIRPVCLGFFLGLLGWVTSGSLQNRLFQHLGLVGTSRWIRFGILLPIFLTSLQAGTVIKLGNVTQIRGPQDLDLEGQFVYAINFSANDPARTVRGVVFLPDRLGIPGAKLVGPQQVSPWQTKPEFGATADANNLEEVFQDIRWANSGGNERLRAELAVQVGDEYKLQILISANGNETRRWDIRVNGLQAVDEVTSLGVSPGESYSRGRATLYTYSFTATSATAVVEMGDLFGANDGGDRNPIWQGLTLERVTSPPTPDDIALEALQFFPTQTQPIAKVTVSDRRFSANHELQFVPGDGDADNSRFTLTGLTLHPGPFDFRAQPHGTRYTIRIRATDASDPKRFLEKSFTLTLEAPHAPTSLGLDSPFVATTAVTGSVVSLLEAVDVDGFDRHRFELVPGVGDQENMLFSVELNQLKLIGVRPSGLTQFRVRLRATDLSGLSVEQPFTLALLEPRVQINEVLANEVGGVEDESGQPQEWIELHNLLSQRLDLTGWYLTDDRDDLTKWRIPTRVVPPGGFLLILADGTGAEVPGSSTLHSNFSISSDGEWIGLVRPDGRTVASEMSVPALYPGISFGVGMSGVTGHLLQPTPGTTNAATSVVGANAVEFSRPHGFYTNSFPLTLTAQVAGSTIRYTTDGTRPTASTGILYSEPILVSPNTAAVTRGLRIIRAIAIHPDAAYAPIATQTYFFVDGIAGPLVDGIVSQSRLITSIARHAIYGPLMGDAFRALPALSVNLTGSLSTREVRASLELIDPNNAEPGFQVECGVGATGTTSLGSPKLSMAARFRAEYGASRLNYPVFARGSMAPGKAASEFKELRLRSHSHDTFYWLGTAENPPVPYGNPPVTRSGDAQLARNLWMDEMQIKMGQPGKRGRQVHLFLNGSYHGIYHVHEHADEDFMASYYPGGPEEFHFSGGGTTGSDHGGGDTWTSAWAAMKASLGNYTSAKRWVDVTNLCDYMVLSFYAGNDWDWSAQHNWGAAGPTLPDRGGWKFFQQDSDISLQDVQADCTDQDVPDGIFSRLMNYPDFRVLFRDRLVKHCFGDGVLTPKAAAEFYDARMTEIQTAIVAETARWQPSSSVGRLPWDRDQEWTNEWRYLRTTFFPLRTARLMGQIRARAGWWPTDPPTLNHSGGVVPAGFQVTFSNRIGQVYYTIDGTDPRLPGGKIHPAARAVGGANPTLTTNLIAEGSVWSFLDTGAVPPVGWTGRGFDDAAWRRGPTQIGYGDGDEATVAGFVDTDPLSEGVQKNITTYFRKTFDVVDPAAMNQLLLRLVRDDSAVVYLNGKEVWRLGLPEGPITPEVRAEAAIGGADESAWNEKTLDKQEYFLEPTGNVLAVEIHQADPGSSDISFNFEMIGTMPAAPANALVIQRPTRILARVNIGSDWSGLVDTYLVPEGTPRASAENLLLTEIQFHPWDEGNNEFLEFFNTAPYMVDLSDVRITNAVEFVFPKGTLLGVGERLVVVKDPVLFDLRYAQSGSAYYRDGIRRLGPWDGSLSNDAETVTVLAADGSMILEVAYGSTGNWPGRADGNGSSLELVRESDAPRTAAEKSAWLGNPRQWRPSSEFHGSPGTLGIGPDNRILINEILASPLDGDSDGIEFLNRSGATISMEGWFVSDNSAEFRKYRFPPGTVILPGERLSIRSVDFDNPANPSSLIPFGLNEVGDDVFLLQAAMGGELLRFVDRVEFGLTPKGTSLGRYPDGTGPFALLQRVSFGTMNSLPVEGYAAWASVTFPRGTPPEDQEASADPDEDGDSNFAEYAFVTSPTRANGPSLEILEDAGMDKDLLVIYRSRTAGRLNYQLEQSADLVSWSTATGDLERVSAVAQPDGSTQVVLRLKQLTTDATVSRFVRVRVQE